MAHSAPTDLNVSKYTPSQMAKMAPMGMAVVGGLIFLLGVFTNPERVWPAYLTSFFYFSCLSIGGLFFLGINNMANAGWSVSIKRFSESLTAFLPAVLIGSLILLAGLKYLYPWADAERMAHDPLLSVKSPYLNQGFFIVRVLVFGLGLLFFGKKMVGNSLKQDESGDHSLTKKNVPLSISFTLFFAIAFSLFSVDLLMALMPHWYSTIFGVYTFAGLFQSTLAFLVLFLIWGLESKLVKGYYSVEHIHDVAKYLKGFTVFWAYIAFSQFMLIWYTNIPEETEFFMLRAEGAWMAISLSLLIFKFAVPFLALLPRAAKRNFFHLKMICYLILVMQYVDIYWLVYPNFNDNHVVFSYYEIGLFLGFLGLFLMSVQKFMTKNSMVATKDPRMHEALTHHVTY